MTALTLAEAPRLRRLPVPEAEPRPALRIVPERGRWLSGARCAPEPTEPASLTGAEGRGEPRPHPLPPPANGWARQFVQTALEAAAGRRPVSQLLRWTSEEVFALLSRRAALAARLERTTAGATCCQVRTVRTCEPRPGIAEASAVVVDRGRCRAVALRLEADDGRWRVTALEIG